MSTDKKSKRYMELQMQELKDAHGQKESNNLQSGRKEDEEIANLYENTAEFTLDQQLLEEELFVIEKESPNTLLNALCEAFPQKKDEYQSELKEILLANWKHLVEVENTHPQEQLDFIEKEAFDGIVDKLKTAFPNYSKDFEEEIKTLFIKRWKLLIEIKKEHIKEEINDLKIRGLKPYYAQKVYKRYHGLD